MFEPIEFSFAFGLLITCGMAFWAGIFFGSLPLIVLPIPFGAFTLFFTALLIGGFEFFFGEASTLAINICTGVSLALSALITAIIFVLFMPSKGDKGASE